MILGLFDGGLEFGERWRSIDEVQRGKMAERGGDTYIPFVTLFTFEVAEYLRIQDEYKDEYNFLLG